jgi:hypothetical protein
MQETGSIISYGLSNDPFSEEALSYPNVSVNTNFKDSWPLLVQTARLSATPGELVMIECLS